MATKRGSADDDIDRLFSLTPEEFTAARDVLARRLKEEGRPDEAGEVRKIRRPTVAAWAANQVARQHGSEVGELLKAGDGLRQAQRKVMSGVKGGGFREAIDRRRKAVAALMNEAERLLADGGKGSAATLEAVQSTFEAASLDDEAGQLLKAGRLSKEFPAPAGFGAVDGLSVVRSAPEPKAKPTEAQRRKEEAETRRAAEREAKQLADVAATARRKAIKLRADAERARDRAEKLLTEAETARAKAREIEKEAREAESAAKKAEARANRT